MPLPDRLLLHLGPGERRLVALDEIYYLEAAGEDSRVRLRSRTLLTDTRPLGEIERLLAPHGFFRAHRDTLVNLRRVREIRRRAGSEDWELKIEPPVNRVLPISRRRLQDLWQVVGG
jgi:DNA-binding LytR/AlgR family response regulator